MKGDRVEIVIDIGTGVQTFEIDASKSGRHVEVTTSRGVVEVAEVTRTGKTVRSGRFMSDRVVALVEHPAETARRRRGQRVARGQSALL
ncbi:MAG: hypothetical protein E6G55_03945 [Actinobacteria bacterium]|jgi:hypothetical protein|nr:MAG: hypothetical protein E6G61_07945 [Actinomycetota bacterium]TMK47157.1 MAG: hypothetical protein E6G55_03945 [Actinomycetota bacterium]TMK63557.1 MAG: hypothetical protein E6G52_07615 [Actinomycetota bacterium]